mmetsp:Transcript_77467/g.185717  ORF Transcript_77467/g.185717 Transcript_77467/m.185717 type:complete len:223 (+) Transcript_77467:687-1355(+)
MRQRIMVWYQSVAKMERLPHHLRGTVSKKPRPVWLDPDRGVNSHDGHENSHLVPSDQELWSRLSSETSNITGHVRCSGQAPVQNHAGGTNEILPRRVDVTCPHAGSKPREAWSEGTIQGEEALPRLCLFQDVLLCSVPFVVRVIRILAFIIPPVGDAGLQVMPQLRFVPAAQVGVREQQPTSMRVSLWTTFRQDPSILAHLLQQLLIAQARLPNASHTHMEI